MYCPKCGAKNEDNYNFCSNCSYPREGEERTNPKLWKQERRMKISLLKVLLGTSCVLLFIILGIWLLGDSGEAKDQREEGIAVSERDVEKDQNQDQNQEQDTEQDASQEVIQGDDQDTDPVVPSEDEALGEDSMQETSLEDFLVLVKESKNAVVMLTRDPDASKYIIDEEETADEATKLFQEQIFEDYKQAFDQMTVLEDYPFIYNPEYLVYFDNDACYTVMADVIAGERVAIVQIEGNDTLYRAPSNLYYNVIQTTLEDDFGYMHIFYTANDQESAMDGAARNDLVELYVRKYYTDMEYNFVEDEVFRIDDIIFTKLSDVNPKLYSALIQYSVKPFITDVVSLPDNMNIYLEDGWIKGGYVVGALWNEENKGNTRSYMLGLTTFEYDVNSQTPEEAAKILYEQSNIKNFIE